MYEVVVAVEVVVVVVVGHLTTFSCERADKLLLRLSLRYGCHVFIS